jgi:hypothetical protein
VARLGRLMLRRGDWEGRQLVRPEAVDLVTRFAGMPLPDRAGGEPAPGSGLCWWTNHDGVWPGVPLDAYVGSGAGNQTLLVVPSLDLVVVRNGAQIGETFWRGLHDCLFAPLMEAVLPPYPQSPVIVGVKWDPPEAVMRQCLLHGRDGSDNWPITWGDDDALYTAYGDGWGFDEPPVEEKISMGIAKVTGDPPKHLGTNIRSDIEQAGFGAAGQKASGMLMVDGVLFMWLRNADHDGHTSQLARSDDHGVTWVLADWRFDEFGYCTFLNFGRDYAGARDGYVYVYSHDHPSAYIPADRMILARVPKDRIEERTAYEFFAGFSADGEPRWSPDVGQRAAVFESPGQCLRSGVSYDAGLGRYLWWHQLPNDPIRPLTRFFGGFGVFDAPEPWGPWTTVFFTRQWDVGPGETACFPTKWMSPDGRTVHLVFSGDDRFSVRRARLRTRGGR